MSMESHVSFPFVFRCAILQREGRAWPSARDMPRVALAAVIAEHAVNATCDDEEREHERAATAMRDGSGATGPPLLTVRGARRYLENRSRAI
jgi:hypothetical protein